MPRVCQRTPGNQRSSGSAAHRGRQAPMTPGPGVEATAASPLGGSPAKITQIRRRLRPRAEPTGSNALPLLPIGARSDLAASSGPMGESHRCCWAGPGLPAPPATRCARALPSRPSRRARALGVGPSELSGARGAAAALEVLPAIVPVPAPAPAPAAVRSRSGRAPALLSALPSGPMRVAGLRGAT